MRQSGGPFTPRPEKGLNGYCGHATQPRSATATAVDDGRGPTLSQHKGEYNRKRLTILAQNNIRNELYSRPFTVLYSSDFGHIVSPLPNVAPCENVVIGSSERFVQHGLHHSGHSTPF